jgi:hypothetical protein
MPLVFDRESLRSSNQLPGVVIRSDRALYEERADASFVQVHIAALITVLFGSSPAR